jgi:hypothetical protein
MTKTLFRHSRVTKREPLPAATDPGRRAHRDDIYFERTGMTSILGYYRDDDISGYYRDDKKTPVIPASLSGNLCRLPQVPAEERTGMTFILRHYRDDN